MHPHQQPVVGQVHRSIGYPLCLDENLLYSFCPEESMTRSFQVDRTTAIPPRIKWFQRLAPSILSAGKIVFNINVTI